MRTRVGEVALRIPQTRGYHDADGRPFYPKSLERGVRSERAMTLAVAEMYVQGVSTRKVTAVVQQLCGLEVTSTQVSRAAAELDEQLTAWRSRPMRLPAARKFAEPIRRSCCWTRRRRRRAIGSMPGSR
ncbi:MAG: hypothetical protein EBZ05_05815 [Verrucomicrobia bacterium]|nr:hypothetical protein [Verrucomicrobiota bacterium]